VGGVETGSSDLVDDQGESSFCLVSVCFRFAGYGHMSAVLGAVSHCDH
jgi:hypothetical protein